jgi:hypothetical protein
MSRLPIMRKLRSLFKPVPMACVDAAFFYGVGQPTLIDTGLHGVPNRASTSPDRELVTRGMPDLSPTGLETPSRYCARIVIVKSLQGRGRSGTNPERRVLPHRRPSPI